MSQPLLYFNTFYYYNTAKLLFFSLCHINSVFCIRFQHESGEPQVEHYYRFILLQHLDAVNIREATVDFMLYGK